MSCHNVDVYMFEDGIFTFWTAQYGSHENDKKIVFRVRLDRTAQDRAKEKDIVGYDRLLPAMPSEIDAWKKSHKNDPIIKEIHLMSIQRLTYVLCRRISKLPVSCWTDKFNVRLF